ncbi:hypothetical protein LTS10_011715 [Elasticomyces elasticus]|nr:hypothetical protein LTS10_011715 [Elasticomyces elasticus]
MASHINKDGEVLAPLNISAPAPVINLKGFKWTTVDRAIKAAQRVKDGKEVVFANGGPSSNQKHLADGNAEAEAARHLPAQVEKQLGLNAVPPPQLLPFPLTKFQGLAADPDTNLDKVELGKLGDNEFPDDNILELNLTTEQLTFGSTIGDIPNRGLFGQPDITLTGLPYLQTIQDVTNVITGRGDRTDHDGIHFEPGMWLHVPESTVNPTIGATVVRMASIPHGTTINAQGLVPKEHEDTASGGAKGKPQFDKIDITPTLLADGTPIPFPSLKSENKFPPRIPQNLEMFNKEMTITNEIILNPNLVLKNAIEGQTISDFVTFEVSTGPQPSTPKSETLSLKASPEVLKGSGTGTTSTRVESSSKSPPTAPNIQASPSKTSTKVPNGGTTNTSAEGTNGTPLKSQEQSSESTTASLDGGGTSNIAFLVGQTEIEVEGGPKTKKIGPNANAAFMTSKFWIETVQYKVNVGLMTSRDPVLLYPTMPEGSTAPTPMFLVTPPSNSNLPSLPKTITIPGTQIQYSQQVNLVFAKLNWPHVSVATLVPTEPQLFTMPG